MSLMPHQPLSPRLTHIFLDSCAFNPDEDEALSSESLCKNAESTGLMLEITHSVQREIDHPKTPNHVKSKASRLIYTIEENLTTQELARRSELRSLMRGNSTSDKYDQDADHLFELTKYSGYFVTTDKRILSKSETMWRKHGVTILKPSDMLVRIQNDA
jgi:hypothetical protein